MHFALTFTAPKKKNKIVEEKPGKMVEIKGKSARKSRNSFRLSSCYCSCCCCCCCCDAPSVFTAHRPPPTWCCCYCCSGCALLLLSFHFVALLFAAAALKRQFCLQPHSTKQKIKKKGKGKEKNNTRTFPETLSANCMQTLETK